MSDISRQLGPTLRAGPHDSPPCSARLSAVLGSKYGGETKASAGRVVGGKLVDWLNGGTPFEATEAYFTVSEASELPEAGEYVADLIFHRVGGSEGGEDLVVHNVTITVSEP